MKRKLFKNYEFEFDTNQKKVLTSFAKQSSKQMATDDRLVKEVRLFDSIIEKLETSEDKIKFTKDEKTKLVFQLKENIKHLQKTMDKSWWIKKWFYKSMLGQYVSILGVFEE
ncbi:MAG: hypothetical protein V3V16_11240 [Melioribacteraceae bacterium]